MQKKNFGILALSEKLPKWHFLTNACNLKNFWSDMKVPQSVLIQNMSFALKGNIFKGCFDIIWNGDNISEYSIRNLNVKLVQLENLMAKRNFICISNKKFRGKVNYKYFPRLLLNIKYCRILESGLMNNFRFVGKTKLKQICSQRIF